MRRYYSKQDFIKSSSIQTLPPKVMYLIAIGMFVILLLVAQSVRAANMLMHVSAANLETQSLSTDVGHGSIHALEEFQAAVKAFKDRDYYQAERYLLPLAEGGYKDAQFILGMLYDAASNDRHKAVVWYIKAAQKGHSEAQHNLGMAYARGNGIKGDIKQALKWWQAAAEQGNSDSQYNLGIIYATGVPGVEQNFTQAKRWWHLAASSGDAMAQYNLGAMYANGVAGQQNLCEAAHWWSLSQENGFSQANEALSNLIQVVDMARCQ